MKFWKNVLLILGVIVIVTAGYSFVKHDNDPNKIFICGFKLNKLASGSMAPEIKTGDIVLSKDVKFEDIKVGDVISYECSAKDLHEKQDRVVMHRVIKKTDTYIKTKGDFNKVKDPWTVKPEQVVSKYVYNFSTEFDKLMKIQYKTQEIEE